MRFVERAFCKTVAVALADTGCTEEYVRLMLQLGLVEARKACRKVLLSA